MLTASLISLPPDTVRGMVEAESAGARGTGGGNATERRCGLVLLVLTVAAASIFALLLH
jgi:hypothetical protein